MTSLTEEASHAMSRGALQVLELSQQIVQAPLGFKDYGVKGMEQQEDTLATTQ